MIIAIQGGRGGVGRTTLSMALATVLANAGNKVLLFEMDFSNPVFHELLTSKAVEKRYVNDYLIDDDVKLDDIVEDVGEHAGFPKKTIFAAYANPAIGARNSIEVLNAKRDKRVTKTLREEEWRLYNPNILFDYVIIDSPVWLDFILANITSIADTILYLLRPTRIEINILKDRLRNFYPPFRKPLTGILNFCPHDEEKIKRVIHDIRSIGLDRVFHMYYDSTLVVGLDNPFRELRTVRNILPTVEKVAYMVRSPRP